MQGSRAWLRLRRAWGVVSTELVWENKSAAEAAAERGESQAEGSVSELRCWGSRGWA